MKRRRDKPPVFAEWLLARSIEEYDRDYVLGDFEELYCEISGQSGISKAVIWYWTQVAKSLPHFINNFFYWRAVMLKSYLLIALRNIKKQKGFYFVNISGLMIGIVSFVLIGLFIMDELSYDRYHEKADRIYRIGSHVILNGEEYSLATACAPMAETLAGEFPEVLASTRLRRFHVPAVRYDEMKFSEERWFFADPAFFDVFTVPFLKGEPAGALADPNSVVITESMSLKYFGEGANPVGKTLNLDESDDYIITGVIEDVPSNSHVHYDFLASMTTVDDSRNQNWISSNYHTYFVLREETDTKEFVKKLDVLMEKYIAPQLKAAMGVTVEEFLESGNFYEYIVQPLTDIHLHSHFRFEHEPNGDMTYVYIFSIIAVALLLIACVNFVNLSTARSADRAKEVSVRKTVGGDRGQLFKQFMSESVLMSLLAAVLAVPVIHLVLPSFNEFTGKELSMSYIENTVTIPFLLVLALVVGLVAGFYPSLYLAAINPVRVLKGMFRNSKKDFRVRDLLVIFQFAISIVLLVGTFIVYEQLEFISSKKLGFRRERIVVLKKADALGNRLSAFKRELLNRPDIVDVANSTNLMGGSYGDGIYLPTDQPERMKRLLWRSWTDPDFLKTYGMEMAGGSFFVSRGNKNRDKVVLNEKAVEALNLSNPIGQKLINGGREYTVIGVIRNFHFESLKHPIRPMAIHPIPEELQGAYLSVKINSENIRETLMSLRDKWYDYTGGQAFEYEFFDDHFAKIYLEEERTGTVFFVFSILTIIIASMGLFGLTAFIAEKRTKEIGIRKVLGATVAGIIVMLYRQFAIWIVISTAIAWPAAYYIMNKWLMNFAYKTDIEFRYFFLSFGIAMMVTFLTVSVQSMKTARANPVNSLKYE